MFGSLNSIVDFVLVVILAIWLRRRYIYEDDIRLSAETGLYPAAIDPFSSSYHDLVRSLYYATVAFILVNAAFAFIVTQIIASYELKYNPDVQAWRSDRFCSWWLPRILSSFISPSWFVATGSRCTTRCCGLFNNPLSPQADELWGPLCCCIEPFLRVFPHVVISFIYLGREYGFVGRTPTSTTLEVPPDVTAAYTFRETYPSRQLIPVIFGWLTLSWIYNFLLRGLVRNCEATRRTAPDVEQTFADIRTAIPLQRISVEEAVKDGPPSDLIGQTGKYVSAQPIPIVSINQLTSKALASTKLDPFIDIPEPKMRAITLVPDLGVDPLSAALGLRTSVAPPQLAQSESVATIRTSPPTHTSALVPISPQTSSQESIESERSPGDDTNSQVIRSVPAVVPSGAAVPEISTSRPIELDGTMLWDAPVVRVIPPDPSLPVLSPIVYAKAAAFTAVFPIPNPMPTSAAPNPSRDSTEGKHGILLDSTPASSSTDQSGGDDNLPLSLSQHTSTTSPSSNDSSTTHASDSEPHPSRGVRLPSMTAAAASSAEPSPESHVTQPSATPEEPSIQSGTAGSTAFVEEEAKTDPSSQAGVDSAEVAQSKLEKLTYLLSSAALPTFQSSQVIKFSVEDLESRPLEEEDRQAEAIVQGLAPLDKVVEELEAGSLAKV